MDESSFVLMEMDTILRLHIFCDIASRGFFHIVIRRKIYSQSVDIYREIRMMMYLVWTWDKYISYSSSEYNEDDSDN